MITDIKDESHYMRIARVLTLLNFEIKKLEQNKGDISEIGYLYNEKDRRLKQMKKYDDKVHPNRGTWFALASGRRFFPHNPKPEEVHIEDIAHALSRQCRFCGNIEDEHYSVAQHSVLVSQVVESWAALPALLHDGAEAILGDVITPIKKDLPQYIEMEDKITAVIFDKYGIDNNDKNLWKEIKRADHILLSTEFRDIARSGVRISEPEQPPMDEKITECWKPNKAKKKFLKRFEELWLPILKERKRKEDWIHYNQSYH